MFFLLVSLNFFFCNTHRSMFSRRPNCVVGSLQLCASESVQHLPPLRKTNYPHTFGGFLFRAVRQRHRASGIYVRLNADSPSLWIGNTVFMWRLRSGERLPSASSGGRSLFVPSPQNCTSTLFGDRLGLRVNVRLYSAAVWLLYSLC